jgi:glutamate-ammonia-ligase adenylyltransferase
MSRDAAESLLAEPPGPRALASLRGDGFADPERAAREIRLLAGDLQSSSLLAPLLRPLLRALGESPEPDAALGRLERLARAAGDRAGLLSMLRARGPDSLRALAWALGGSPFAAETLIRRPDWVPWTIDPLVLSRPRSARAIAGDLESALEAAPPGGTGDILRAARRREIVAVALRDLLRLASVEETLASLSALADALLPAAFVVAEGEARHELRLPGRDRRKGGSSGFAVLALGKLGGSELNFSSDVDLVYVHRTDAGTATRDAGGPSRHEYAEALGRRLTAALGETTHEGHVYRVDLRLRPEGRAGAISHSLRSADEYYRTRGRAWERLALLRARPVAGDLRLAEEFLARVDPFVWGRPLDGDAARQVLHMKAESDRRLAARGLTARHVKLGRGGIREVELLAQVLQIRHGAPASGRPRPLRARGTLEALSALRAAGELPAPEHEALASAYVFLRDVENKLQMVHDAQTHVLPADDHEQHLLARRLGYAQGGEGRALERFRGDLGRHRELVHRLFTDLLVRRLGGGSAP